ncbi:hypothetical protein RYX36_025189 [Vicia faba]
MAKRSSMIETTTAPLLTSALLQVQGAADHLSPPVTSTVLRQVSYIFLTASSSYHHQTITYSSVPLSYEFEFSARFGSTGSAVPSSMTSANELFLNGQIRPMKLSSHLERP